MVAARGGGTVVGSDWRTEAFARLHTRLGSVLGDKTAAEFGKLGLQTVGDLLAHLPRRYFSGTELSDLSALEEGEEVAVLAEVQRVTAHNVPGRGSGAVRGKPRLEAVITDHKGSLTLAFFGKAHMIAYWHDQLTPGSRGIFAGKVGVFRDQFQLAHPDFVMLDANGAVVGGARRNEVLTRVTRVTADRDLPGHPQAADLGHRRVRGAGPRAPRRGRRPAARRGP